MIGPIFGYSVEYFEELLFDASPADDLHLMLVSQGGDGEVAVRLVCAAQARCARLTVIVPENAKERGHAAGPRCTRDPDGVWTDDLVREGLSSNPDRTTKEVDEPVDRLHEPLIEAPKEHAAIFSGLWLGELTHFYDYVRDHGFEVDIASPSGGFVPIDPESLSHEHLSELGTGQRYRDRDFMNLLETPRRSRTSRLQNELMKLGGDYSTAGKPFETDIVTDSALITGQNPGSARAVAEAVVDRLEPAAA
jgi:putative intracellular protease/amidase